MKIPVRYRNLSFVVILALGLVWIYNSRVTPERTISTSQQPFESFLAPDFNATTLGSELVHLSDYIGHPVIMNFWASWCPPCRAEMPALQAVHNSYADEGLVVLAINAADQDNFNDANVLIAELDLTFQILFDNTGVAQDTYQVTALPTTLFIDRAGIIQTVVVGGPMAEAFLEIKAQQLLGEIP